MPYTSIQIRTYNVESFSSNQNPASINLYDKTGKHFAIAIFRPDSEDLPEANHGTDGKYRLYYYRKYFSDVIDLLRNEKPVYMHFWSGAGSNTHIGTKREPVGEEET